MTERQQHLTIDQPAFYRIRLQGRLGAAWSQWLDGMAIAEDPTPSGNIVTTLTGQVADQAALFGLLSRIRDLGLPLLLVEYLQNGGTE